MKDAMFSPGMVVRVAEGDLSRLAYIVRFTGDRYVVRLCHPYPEYAVSSDQIYYDVCSYPLVVQRMVVGTVYRSQITDIVATVTSDDEYSYGVQMFGQFDARYEFRRSEIRDVQLLSARCFSDESINEIEEFG